MSSQTANYGLIKPGMNDSAIITSENTNMDSIDTILKRVEDDIDALEALKATLIGDAQTKADAVSALIDGQALEPASVQATGAISGSSVSDSVGTLAALRESVSQFDEKFTFAIDVKNVEFYALKNSNYTALVLTDVDDVRHVWVYTSSGVSYERREGGTTTVLFSNH